VSHDSKEMDDIVLEGYVHAVNRSVDTGIGVTLFVGGSVITGMLIGIAEYYSLLGDFWAETFKNDTGAMMAKSYKELSKRTHRSLTSQKDDDHRPPVFIHLKNAQVVSADGMVPSSPTMLWRGRIGQVQGYAMGTLQRSLSGGVYNQ
jgi:hypothetical protein